jgi:hypothetical protein
MERFHLSVSLAPGAPRGALQLAWISGLLSVTYGDICLQSAPQIGPTSSLWNCASAAFANAAKLQRVADHCHSLT